MTDFAPTVLDEYALVRRKMHAMSKDCARGEKAVGIIDVGIRYILRE